MEPDNLLDSISEIKELSELVETATKKLPVIEQMSLASKKQDIVAIQRAVEFIALRNKYTSQFQKDSNRNKITAPQWMMIIILFGLLVFFLKTLDFEIGSLSSTDYTAGILVFAMLTILGFLVRLVKG